MPKKKTPKTETLADDRVVVLALSPHERRLVAEYIELNREFLRVLKEAFDAALAKAVRS